MRDFFYRLGISKELGEHFALPGLSVPEIRSSETLMQVPSLRELVEKNQVSYIYPHLSVLPMGFSWAFHLAHQAHWTLALRMLPGVRLVEDRTPVPPLGRGDCALLLYADNANHLGTDAAKVDNQPGVV